MAMVRFQGVPDGHWIVGYGNALSVFFSERSLAKNIEFELFEKPDTTLSVQFFSAGGYLDASELVRNWDFGNTDARLVDFNELRDVRPSEKIHMLPFRIPGGRLPEVQEEWKRLYNLKKRLEKERRDALAHALVHLLGDNGL